MTQKHYQLLIDKGFSDERVFLNFGLILQQIGQLKEAEISTRKAIELNPNFVDAHHNLGNILNNLGNRLKTRKNLTYPINESLSLISGAMSSKTMPFNLLKKKSMNYLKKKH